MRFLLSAVLLGLPAGAGAAYPHELDFAASPAWLATLFQSMTADGNVRLNGPAALFTLPATKGPGNTQTWLTSKFPVTGDFEVAVRLDGPALPMPQSGYGMTAGVAVDSLDESVAVVRGRDAGGGDHYGVWIRTRRGDADDFQGWTYSATSSATAELFIVRSGQSAACYVAEGPGPAKPRLLTTVSLRADRIDRVRLLADTGGALQPMAARFRDLRVKFTGLPRPTHVGVGVDPEEPLPESRPGGPPEPLPTIDDVIGLPIVAEMVGPRRVGKPVTGLTIVIALMATATLIGMIARGRR